MSVDTISLRQKLSLSFCQKEHGTVLSEMRYGFAALKANNARDSHIPDSSITPVPSGREPSLLPPQQDNPSELCRCSGPASSFYRLLVYFIFRIAGCGPTSPLILGSGSTM